MQYIAFYKPEQPQTAPPSPEHMAEMARLIEQQRKSGELIASGGFLPADQGLRVRLAHDDFTVRDGAGGATGELGGGFGILQAKSKAELIEQVKNFLKVAGPGECTIRLLMDGPPPQ
jgi:hypothetical protein